MSWIRPQDRASLCSFTFADGRRCRTPLSSRHPRLCFDHARKEAKAHPADQGDSDRTFSSRGIASLPAISAWLSPASCPSSPMTKSNTKPPLQSPASPEHCCTPSSSLSMSTSAPPPKRVRPGRAAAPKPQQNMPNTNPPKINTHISASK
jgi:hypothetical protein